MRARIASAAASLLLAACAGSRASPPALGAHVPDPVWVTVRGPTFLAFFPPVTEEQTAADDALNTTLDDFGWHLAEATGALREQGFTIEARFADTLWLRAERERWRFVPPDSAPIGYYLVAPGRTPHVEYHVHTDTELVELGAAYLRGDSVHRR